MRRPADRGMTRPPLRAAALCAALALACGGGALAEPLASGAGRAAGGDGGDGGAAAPLQRTVLVSSLNAAPRADAAGGVENTRTLLAGAETPEAAASGDAFNEKLRAAFDSKPKGGGSASAPDDAAPAPVTTSSSVLRQPAAEQHGNTRHVMGSDTPPPPVIAGAAGGAPRAEPQAAGAAPSAKAASPQEASGKPADTGSDALLSLLGVVCARGRPGGMQKPPQRVMVCARSQCGAPVA